MPQQAPPKQALPNPIPDPIALHASERPGALAAVELSTGARQTYEQLHALVSGAAGWLAANGAASGERIAYLGRNSLLQLAVLFAARRLGAVFVPLNWRLSPPELAVLIEDAAPALMLADEEFAPSFSGPLHLTNDPALAAAIAAAPPVATGPDLPPAAPAIILYTSGTTGRPKGAAITRANAWYGGHNFSNVGQVTQHSVMLCDAPMFHTVGLMAVAQTAMQQGAAIILSSRFDPAQSLDVLAAHAPPVTHYFAVPQIAQMLRDHPAYDAPSVARLTALFTGGAPMPPALIEAFLADGVTLANGYGMTEVGTVLCMPLDRARIAQRLTAAGLPAPAVCLRIVKKDGADAAPGESGELWLKGPGIIPGYWNRPEETARAFAPGGWFRTGDAASVDAAGYYTLLDRWKDMYITGGENVYPAEVEAVLARLPGVTEAAVIGVPDARWGEAGLAFIVPDPVAPATEHELQTACNAHLARYKQPRAIRFLDALPRTASGKVRKDLLREMAGG